MKRFSVLLISAIWFLLGTPLVGQMRISGFTESSMYTFETPTAHQGNFYQNTRLKVLSATYPRLALATYFRVGKLGDTAWSERLYSFHLRWKVLPGRLSFTLGRQFVYRGVLNGTLDGLLSTFHPHRAVTVSLFAGVAAPPDRAFAVLTGSEGSALGGYASWKAPGGTRIDVSYFQRERGGQWVWQQAGLAVNGVWRDRLYYQARYDHNLQTGQFQGMRYRLSYFLRRWTAAVEYNRQKPRIYEDSYFRIFRQRAYQQVRSLVSYRFRRYEMGIQYVFTDVEFNQTHQWILTFGNDWGYLGLVWQNGFGGKNIGVYGDIRLNPLPKLSLRFSSSYANYQRHSIRIDEEATAFSLGADYELFPGLVLKAEVQQSINSAYKSDLRGLFRMAWRFSR